MNKKIECTCPNCGAKYEKELYFLHLTMLS